MYDIISQAKYHDDNWTPCSFFFIYTLRHRYPSTFQHYSSKVELLIIPCPKYARAGSSVSPGHEELN